jgi:hypothetical protein
MRLSKDNKLQTDSNLGKIIIQLLFKMQNGKCNNCGDDLISYQVHHYRYGEDITINDLGLLCANCHAIESGVKTCKGIMRDFLIA